VQLAGPGASRAILAIARQYLVVGRPIPESTGWRWLVRAALMR
jgi:hypothetical protein